MPSRRYYIAIAPVQHLNGKLAPCRVKCPNTSEPEPEPVTGFMYGYKRKESPEISRFGFRDMCRDLNTHPYTPAEEENRILFTASLAAVHEHKAIAADWALCMADFERQDRYKTPIGFAVAACRYNGGEWLEDWVA